VVRFTFGPSGASIEEDLNNLVKVVHDLIREGLTDKSKKSLKRLLKEIAKIYNMIVTRVASFYAIDSDAKFRRTFSNKYHEFKEIYLKHKESDLEYSCKKVKKELDILLQKRKDGTWYYSLRDLFCTEKGKSKKEANLNNLENLINIWFVNDRIVFDRMRGLQDELNQGLDEVNLSCNSGGTVSKSRKQLQIFLKSAEPRFKKIQNNRVKLKMLSDEL
jgi:hypothetical protein